MYHGNRSSSATVSLSPTGTAPLASPERDSNGRPARRPPSDTDVALARKREMRRQLMQRIRSFRRGGLAAWEDYHTMSAFQIKIAFRVQSAFICMFDIFNVIHEIRPVDGERWEDAVAGLVPYLENTLDLWNPETGVSQAEQYDVFTPTVGMISNSHRVLDAVDRLYFEFFDYLSEKVEISKLFGALMISCTLGRWNAPEDENDQ